MKSNIVLIHRSGGDFHLSDVYLLVSHINKYWDSSIEKPNIYCFTDTVNREVRVVGLTIRPLPNREWKGWWSKLNLFTPQLSSLRPFLYLDIDTVVLQSIDSLFPPEDKKDKFVTLRDFYKPNELASALMWVPDTENIDLLFKKWKSNVTGNTKRFRGDQNFIASVLNADLYWQDISKQDYITTFKPNGKWRTEFPKQSAVVCFHGVPRIPLAAKTVSWVNAYTSYEI